MTGAGPTRVVVVGNGMAGSRLVEELRTRSDDLDITVFGAEPYAPYNRILLSELLAGRHTLDDIYLSDTGWYDAHRVTVHSGLSVGRIDRDACIVHADDGTATPYDVLVLATGSRAWLPPIDGLVEEAGALRPGAMVFRTIDDCRQILAEASGATSAVVVGGGLLGLEAARGLAGRGLAVEVVHPVSHIMERQLDAGAGRVLARRLRELGVEIRVDASAVGVVGDERITGLELADGTVIPSDVVVLACGVRPEVGLAVEAGLTVDRGVVVDDQLRSVSDPRVFAIGECAQHAGQVYGLVAPAWDQAAVVADVVAGADPRAVYQGSRVITRLKAAGIDLASMGETGVVEDDGDGTEVVQFVDPARGTYKKLVIRDDRLVGAILLGEGSTVGSVVQLFDRGAPVPADRLGLLFAGLDAAPAAASPALMPGSATVCHCNNVTKSAIQSCWLAGARDVGGVAAGTRATTGCGTCRDAVEGILGWLAVADPVATDEEVPA